MDVYISMMSDQNRIRL